MSDYPVSLPGPAGKRSRYDPGGPEHGGMLPPGTARDNCPPVVLRPFADQDAGLVQSAASNAGNCSRSPTTGPRTGPPCGDEDYRRGWSPGGVAAIDSYAIGSPVTGSPPWH
jgi:hypothetical protein